MNRNTTVSAVSKSDFKHWRELLSTQRITEQQFEKAKNNMNYFIRVANTVNFDAINAQKFMDLFPNPFWGYEKNDINRVVYETIDRINNQTKKAANPDTQFELLQSLVSDAPHLFKSESDAVGDIEQNIRSCEESINRYQDKMQRYYTEYHNSLVHFNKYQSKKENLLEQLKNAQENATEYDQHLVEQIQKVINTGEFIYLGSSKTGIKIDLFNMGSDSRSDIVRPVGNYFISSTPLVCQYVNQNANVSMRLNFGYWLFILGNQGHVRFSRPVINFMGNNATFHPHFNYGNVCWGSSSYRYEKHTGSKPNFTAILKLLKSLVETYNPDNPYTKLRGLYQYKDSRKLTCLPFELLASIPLGIFPDSMRTQLANKLEELQQEATGEPVVKPVDAAAEAIAAAIPF